MTTAEAAFGRAKRASSAWANTPLKQRIECVRRLRQNLADRCDEAVSALQNDLGKPTIDALSGDLFVTLEALKYYERRAPQLLRNQALPRSSRLLFAESRYYISHSPYGCVLILGPFNYPIQLSVIPAVCALLAGNSVVIKGSEWAPQTHRLLEGLFTESGFLPGAIEILVGDAGLGKALLAQPFDRFFATGGLQTGFAVAKRAATTLTPADLELGGKDVLIVARDAPLERTARAACFAAFANSGQVCVGAKRALVPTSVASEFLRILRRESSELRRGRSGIEEMGPLVRASELTKARELVEEAVAQGARLETEFVARDNFLGPVILSGVVRPMRILDEELFAPVLCIETYDDDEALIEKANAGPFGLRASVFSADIDWAQKIASRLDVGGVSINDVIVPLANPAAPFGGEKFSGLGRSRGDEGLTNFCRKKTISLHPCRRSRERHWFPYTPQTASQLRLFLKLLYGKGTWWQRLGRAFKKS